VAGGRGGATRRIGGQSSGRGRAIPSRARAVVDL
jgi:hypothetical protein